MTSELKELYRTFNLAEADLIHSRLIGAGLNPTLQNEQASLSLGTVVASGGIRVFVPASEYEQAKGLLDAEAAE